MIDTARLNRELETADPAAILRWAVEGLDETLAVVTSFQPTGIVTLHMLYEMGLRVPVLTLDTGLLFPETYALMAEVEQRFNLNLTRIKPAQTVEAQAETYGPALWERNPDLCCNLRKVVPLEAALQGYTAWISGLRRDQSGRANIQIVSQKADRLKLVPFANWTGPMIWTYIRVHELPYNKLHDQGYPSIGCATNVCTQPVKPGETNERSGRWVNSAKTECGIHQ